jgi:hypothetical protein
MGALPTKLYFRIGEVASAVGVETHVLGDGVSLDPAPEVVARPTRLFAA